VKAKWRQPAVWKSALRFLAYAVAAVGLILVLPLAQALLGRLIAGMLFLLLEVFMVLCLIIRPRSMEDDSAWGHLEDRRRARVWRAIRRLRSKDAVPAQKEHASDRHP